MIDTLLVLLSVRSATVASLAGRGLLDSEYRSRCQCRVCAKCTADRDKQPDRSNIEPVDGDEGASCPGEQADGVGRHRVATAWTGPALRAAAWFVLQPGWLQAE